MQIYFLDHNSNVSKYTNVRDVGAWPKLYADLKEFDASIGVQHLYAFTYQDENESEQSVRHRANMVLSPLKEDDLLIIPAPFVFNSTKFTEAIIQQAHEFYHAKVACLTIDIMSFRISDSDVRTNNYQRFFEQKRADEQRILALSDALITQTDEMANAIRDNFGYEGKVIVQGPWGYLTDRVPPIKTKENSLTFAGNPTKALYLRDLVQDPEIEYNVYGQLHAKSGLEAQTVDTTWVDNPAPNFHYKGSFDFSIADKMLEGAFGLIWDSTTFPEVTGGRGLYMQMAMPHKFSMYAVAGMPTIVWKKASVAQIVEGKAIGWTVNDLTEIPALIHSITEADYRQKAENLSTYAELIRSGYFQKRAIFDLVGALYYDETPEIKSDYHMQLGYGD